MLIPRKVHDILEEMDDEVFKNMAIENINAVRRYIDRIIESYQSTESDNDVHDVEAKISDDENANKNNNGVSEEVAKSIKDIINDNNHDEDEQFNHALKYLDSIKKSDHSKHIGIDEVLKAFVIGKIISDESERVFLSGSVLQMQIFHFMNLINSANFNIEDKTQVDTCKLLFSAIKQAVSLNKTANKFGCFTAAGNPTNPQIPIPGIDQTLYKKAAAFEKIVEAFRPVFIELENEKPLMKGFGSPLNGWGN